MDVIKLRHKAQQAYINHNFVLVKLRSDSKIPLEKNWTRLSFRSKFKHDGNYGVVLQNDNVIIDVDPRNFENGEDSFLSLKKDIGGLPTTFVVQTGTGGFHYYYKKPASLICRKHIQKYPGVEFKSKGSQVVAPGSIHPKTKKMYMPYNKTKIVDIVDAPDGLLNLISHVHEKTGKPKHSNFDHTEGKATISRFQHYLQVTDGAVQGCHGDEKTFKVAAFGKDIGLAPDTVCNMMLKFWNDKCTPSWSIKELKTKVKNAYEYGSNKPGCMAFKNMFDDEADDGIPEIKTNKNGLVINSFVNACYFLGSPKIKFFARGKKSMELVRNPLGGIMRYNVLLNMLEYEKPAPWHIVKAGNDISNLIWEPVEVTDAEAVNVKFHIDKMTGLKWGRQDIQDAIVKVAHDNEYNPVTEWLDGLVWDGTLRLETWLSIYCGVENTEYTRAVATKTLCAAVARSYHPGIKFDHMLILEGEQGIGKSTVVKILAGDWYVDIMLRSDSKDAVQLVNSGWILEVSEMAGLRKIEIESLKAFISRAIDSIRPPFGKTPISYPRKSIFIGTINPTSIGYLNDETGNRRYWPVLCDKINISALRRDREHLFAEAIVRFRQGEKLYLTSRRDIDQAMKQQETRSLKHPWQELIVGYFKEYDIKKTTVVDLYLDAINGDKSRFTYTIGSLIRNILKRLRWKKNSSGEYVNPKMEKEIDAILDGVCNAGNNIDTEQSSFGG
jgi:Virulence-associated protein E-like domain/Bifunctional DNA primase/polymerase, N-terminal